MSEDMLDDQWTEARGYSHVPQILAELAARELAEEIEMYEEALRVARDLTAPTPMQALHAAHIAQLTHDHRIAVQLEIVEIAVDPVAICTGRRIA